ncbi:MiaB/RimO family radical SAM methylthiotransferase [bacterium]|nr:MiaB/RimO family radical SAM methylthiotransferase [bacterium]
MTEPAENKSAAVAFRTLGCKQNQFDARWLQSQLPGDSFTVAADLHQADWIVLTCCAVTERALAKARGELHRLKRSHPQAKVVVVGCGSRYQPDQFSAADFVDQLPQEFQIAGYSNGIGSNLHGSHGLVPQGRSRAFLRIQNGCDQFCAFCIVPHLRGKSSSVPEAELQQSLQELVKAGVAEVVLTGTNIALWGRDLNPQADLLDLLKSLSKDLKYARLRLSSLEPQFTPLELISWCTEQENICNHFHVAVQSGSDRILNKMGRGGLNKQFFTALSKIKKARPGLSLGADILVGFPSESENDFQATIKLLEEVPFNYLHVFPYSERQGTPAASFPDSISKTERLARAANLRKLDSELRLNFINSNIGRSADVITLSEKAQTKIQGLTSNYLRVQLQPGQISSNRRFTTKLSKTSFNL